MRISEAARRAGVSVHTLRFYERKGLLPRTARSASNYRDYSPAAVEWLAVIRAARRIGFTLAEVRALLDLRNTPMGCAELRLIAQKKQSEIDAELRRLEAMKSSIQKLLRDCERAAEPCAIQIQVERARRG